MFLYHINLLNKNIPAPLLRGHYLYHLSGLTFFPAGNSLYCITLFNPYLHYTTSGARDIIFMNFFHLSSLATGPNILVPTGSPWGLIRTAAFLSNLMYEPSSRRILSTDLTTTAFATCPFFAVPSGIASLTLTTMTSPIPAYLLLDPPITLIHMTFFAPELSATSKIVLG